MASPDLWNQPDQLLDLGNTAYLIGEHGAAIHFYAGSLIARAGFELADGERFGSYPTAGGTLEVPVQSIAQVSMPKIPGLHIQNVRVSQLDVSGWDRTFHVIEHYNIGDNEDITSEPIVSQVLSVAASKGKPAEWPIPDQSHPFRDGVRGAFQVWGHILTYALKELDGED